MSEWCERTSEQTSEWPSTLRVYSLIIRLTVQWRNVAFYGLVASLVFHNVLSALHGTRSLFHAHQVKPLRMLNQAWWRYLVIAAHLVGLGNIMIPLTLIFSSSDMSEAQFKER